MLVKNCNAYDLVRVCEEVGVSFPYSPYFVKGGIRVRFVPKRDEDYKKEHGHYRYQRRSAGWQNTERKIWALCWHGYREAFRALFKIAPASRVYTALARRAGIKFYNSENFEKVFPATGLVNIGAPIMPVQAREACFCWETFDDTDDLFTVCPSGLWIRHSKSELKDGKLELINTTSQMDRFLLKQVRQSSMSAECWPVQINGPQECETCEHRDTSECGGQEIRKTGKNSHGLEVPL